MIVLAGSYDQDQGGMGGFQEWNQASLLVCFFIGSSLAISAGRIL